MGRTFAAGGDGIVGCAVVAGCVVDLPRHRDIDLDRPGADERWLSGRSTIVVAGMGSSSLSFPADRCAAVVGHDPEHKD